MYKHISSGREISDYAYANLHPTKKPEYKHLEDTNTNEESFIPSVFTDTLAADILSNSNEDTSITSDFSSNDFGGGDSGGAGAGGDF